MFAICQINLMCSKMGWFSIGLMIGFLLCQLLEGNNSKK